MLLNCFLYGIWIDQFFILVDLLNIHDAVAVFEQKRLRNANDRVMDVSEIVMVLLPIYELLVSATDECLIRDGILGSCLDLSNSSCNLPNSGLSSDSMSYFGPSVDE